MTNQHESQKINFAMKNYEEKVNSSRAGMKIQ